MNLNYQVTEIEERIYTGPRNKMSKAGKVLNEFMESGKSIAGIEFGKTESVKRETQNLRSYIKRNRMDLKIIKRANKIYIVRGEKDAEQG